MTALNTHTQSTKLQSLRIPLVRLPVANGAAFFSGSLHGFRLGSVVGMVTLVQSSKQVDVVAALVDDVCCLAPGEVSVSYVINLSCQFP